MEEPVVGVAADLRAPVADPWRDLDVPAGWQDVAAVASAVAADLDGLAASTVAAIATELPGYDVTVPSDDLTASVTRTVEMMLVGIAENRGPRPDEITIRRELGHRRALQGLPVRSLVRAYHIGYRELWHALVTRVPADDRATATALLSAAPTVWGWVHEITDAIVEAHEETTRALQAQVVGARQRFTELLVNGDLEADEVLRLGASIGFDPGGPFRVLVAAVGASDGTEARHLQSALGTVPGRHAVVSRGPYLIATTQDAEQQPLVAVVTEVLPTATVGVGMERGGLTGARASLGDAELALGIAGTGTVARFEDQWLWATLRQAAPRLSDVLARGAGVAAEHPHLAETVLAFAEAGFSVSESARQLDLHANTVAYRLERWHALTGWDPRTFAGLTRSVAALRLTAD